MDNIKTERLMLRDLCDDDAINIFNLFSNKNVTYFLDSSCANIEQAKRDVKKILNDTQFCPRMRYESAVDLLDTEAFIGIVVLHVEFSPIVDSRADLSYYFLPEFWHKGYATEAGKALIKFGFEILGVNKITAGCLKCNTSSERVMIQCNMQKEAELKKHCRFNGKWENRVEYAILKDEYFAE